MKKKNWNFIAGHVSEIVEDAFGCENACVKLPKEVGEEIFSETHAVAHKPTSDQYTYSTVGCRRTGGRRSQPGSFLFFTTSANLVLILQSVFRSRRLLVARKRYVTTHAGRGMRLKHFKPSKWSRFEVRAMPPKKSSSQQTLFACGEPFLTHFSSLGRSYF